MHLVCLCNRLGFSCLQTFGWDILTMHVRFCISHFAMRAFWKSPYSLCRCMDDGIGYCGIWLSAIYTFPIYPIEIFGGCKIQILHRISTTSTCRYISILLLWSSSIVTDSFLHVFGWWTLLKETLYNEKQHYQVPLSTPHPAYSRCIAADRHFGHASPQVRQLVVLHDEVMVLTHARAMLGNGTVVSTPTNETDGNGVFPRTKEQSSASATPVGHTLVSSSVLLPRRSRICVYSKIAGNVAESIRGRLRNIPKELLRLPSETEVCA